MQTTKRDNRGVRDYWHTIYTRMNRWSKNGVLDRVFECLQREQILRIKLEAVSMDNTIVAEIPSRCPLPRWDARAPQ